MGPGLSELWLLAAGVLVGLLGVIPERWLGVVLGLAVVATFAGWASVRSGWVGPADLRGYVVAERRLVEVVGVVVREPMARRRSEAVLGGFSFRPERRTGVISAENLTVDGEAVAVEGRLLLALGGEGASPGVGERIRARGWLMGMQGRMNPGGFDARRVYGQQGVYGRLWVPAAENWEGVEHEANWSWSAWRAGWSDQLSEGLLAGMGQEGEAAALVDAVVLGRRSEVLSGLAEAYRQSGLAHLLAISGTHVGIVGLLAWGCAGLFVRHPGRRRLWVLAGLLLYLLVLPARPSVVRSGIMAGCLLLAGWSGRRLSGLDGLGLAAVLVLAMDPRQVADPGFQMSFAAVLGILLHLGWRARREPGAAELLAGPLTPADRVRRWAVMLLEAGLAAWAATLPLVAYHFGLIALAGPVWTLVATPVLFVLIGLGLVKMLLGLVWLGGSAMLGGVLSLVADGLNGLAALGGSMGWLWLLLPTGASVVVAVGLAVAVGGWLMRVRPPLMLLVAALSGFVVMAGLVVDRAWRSNGDALRVTFLSVGHGNAYVVELPDGGGVWMVDAGGFVGSAELVVLPALRALGVSQLAGVVVTHADLDHYSGVPELLAGIVVDRVVVPEGFVDEATLSASSAVGVMLKCVEEAGLAVERVGRGCLLWEERGGGVAVRVLWPEAGWGAEGEGVSDNDRSLVLELVYGRRRLLLTGDIDEPAVAGVARLEPGLAVDVMDLPHHGSRRAKTMAWVAGLSPGLVVQSSGWPRGSGGNPWREVLAESELLEVYRDGAVTVEVGPDGALRWCAWGDASGK